MIKSLKDLKLLVQVDVKQNQDCISITEKCRLSNVKLLGPVNPKINAEKEGINKVGDKTEDIIKYNMKN